MMDFFGYGIFGGFGFIFMLVWWVVIIAVVAAVVKWIFASGTAGIQTKSALDILKERYARGEINKQEFEDKSREIKNL